MAVLVLREVNIFQKKGYKKKIVHKIRKIRIILEIIKSEFLLLITHPCIFSFLYESFLEMEERKNARHSEKTVMVMA